jgi:hypothetical protein
MRIEELRIGNWVQDEHGIAQYIYRLWKGGAELSKDENGSDDMDYAEDEIFGIPLTEEWLIKFGFEKVIYESDETGYGTDYELDIKGVGCISYSDDFSCALFGSKESSKHELGFLPNWDNCKHVHSLQNLYFALTGEELKIKE